MLSARRARLCCGTVGVVLATTEGAMLDLPPRHMWGWGQEHTSGFCGSASTQSALLYFGNWVSQGVIRGTSGGQDHDHQLLPAFEGDVPASGASLLSACGQLRLNCTMWDYRRQPAPQSGAFLKWAERAIDAGQPVIFGVYETSLADDEFDHIVPMVGYDDDHIFFNDLIHNETQRYSLRGFAKSRQECSNGTSDDPTWCLPEDVDYGLIVHGNSDPDSALVRLQMAVSSRSEPDYSQEDGLDQRPLQLVGALTASGLSAGERYALLRYDDYRAVPERDFLSSGFAERIDFVAVESTYSHAVSFMSNSSAVFRCVAAAVAGGHGGRRLRGPRA